MRHKNSFILALKDCVVSSILLMVKKEDLIKVKIMNSLKEIKSKKVVMALDNTPPTLLQMAQAIKLILFIIDEPPLFESLQIFIKFIKNKYRDFKHDQM